MFPPGARRCARSERYLRYEPRSVVARTRASQARKLLAPVYHRFTEGFGTADLIAAKRLLASLR
jgi:predicted ATPase